MMWGTPGASWGAEWVALNSQRDRCLGTPGFIGPWSRRQALRRPDHHGHLCTRGGVALRLEVRRVSPFGFSGWEVSGPVPLFFLPARVRTFSERPLGRPTSCRRVWPGRERREHSHGSVVKVRRTRGSKGASLSAVPDARLLASASLSGNPHRSPGR
jgi:hypothetical protein